MKSSTFWFGWTTLLLPLHMGEQLAFGLDELAMIKRVLAVYYGWFTQPDVATVVLVTLGATLVMTLTFAILGGRWRQASVAIWNLVALGEIHHVIESLQAGRYRPGLVTAIPYVVFGVLLLRALIREVRNNRELTAPTPQDQFTPLKAT